MQKSWIVSSSSSMCNTRIVLATLSILLSIAGFAQQNRADSVFLNSDQIETIKMVSDLDPNKAALLSAVLPGLGQAYNNQYWKIPIVYGGGLLIGHYINYNHKIYHEMRNALIAEQDNDPTTENIFAERFQESALTRNRDAFRRNRDLLIIIGAAFYLLNIVDAHVSAHLHEFEVNDNLSMQVKPSIQSTALFSHSVGISLSLNLK
ncbi:hypothetical protein C7460_11597 [Marinoscillum furvescens DSM 4134]|uniref:DUF5683 domain-containing protein n=1 Tax=Marinoscillum furvescens DSM 4134 TaxID=1122208 RepID=A0A3D9L219_MARFU|nr:hypothetical protein C7460_11597 [Marinoscillum furvescens DSM 4134]